MVFEKGGGTHGRALYVPPTSSYTSAEQMVKVVRFGSFGRLGVSIPRDIQYAMRLVKGQILKVRLELVPSDALKLEMEQLNEVKQIQVQLPIPSPPQKQDNLLLQDEKSKLDILFGRS